MEGRGMGWSKVVVPGVMLLLGLLLAPGLTAGHADHPSDNPAAEAGDPGQGDAPAPDGERHEEEQAAEKDPQVADAQVAPTDSIPGSEDDVLKRFAKEREQQFPLMPGTKHPFAHGAPIRFLVQW